MRQWSPTPGTTVTIHKTSRKAQKQRGAKLEKLHESWDLWRKPLETWEACKDKLLRYALNDRGTSSEVCKRHPRVGSKICNGRHHHDPGGIVAGLSATLSRLLIRHIPANTTQSILLTATRRLRKQDKRRVLALFLEAVHEKGADLSQYPKLHKLAGTDPLPVCRVEYDALDAFLSPFVS